MLNILKVDPPIIAIPKEPLRRAAETLKDVAEQCAREETLEDQGRRIRFRLLHTVTKGAVKPPTYSLDVFQQAIKDRITRTWGKKGPTENAFQELAWLAARAQKAGYPLHKPKLQKAFMYFLMSYVTVGFEGQDTTGTQIGNFQGDWRGGGF